MRPSARANRPTNTMQKRTFARGPHAARIFTFLTALVLVVATSGCDGSSNSTARPQIDAPGTGQITAGAEGTAYEFTIPVSGTGPFTWEVVAGALPPGITLAATTGLISGTPTADGSFTFTVRATNAIASDEVELTMTVAAIAVAPQITTATLPDGAASVAYSGQLAASGTAPITWTVSTGALPDGLALGASTGLIAGTPTADGQTTFTVTATNAAGADTQQLTLTVAEAPTGPTIDAPGTMNQGVAVLPAGTVDSAYSQTFQATGTAPITWHVSSGQLPQGMTLDDTTGELSGTPTASGDASFTVTATNSVDSDTQECSLHIADMLTLSGISPSTAPVGAGVLLTGTGFDTETWSNNVVRFDGDLAKILDVTATTIVAEVIEAQPSSELSVTVTIGSETTDPQTLTVSDTAIRFVDADATAGANDGSSWSDAYTDLASALAAPPIGMDELWVAAGTYLPGTERSDTFELTLVKVYGGFAGTEGQREDRDWVQNPTILSGDLQGDDQPDFVNRGDNSQHVVTISGSAEFDGFIVERGNADGAGGTQEEGGLVYASAAMSIITIRNCVFREGMSSDKGGGVFMTNGSLDLANCRFEKCSGKWGGGITIQNNNPVSYIRRSAFYDCSSTDGPGGVYTNGGANLTHDCVFVGCRGKYGGALSLNVGGTVDNCTFFDNTTTYTGGGIFVSPDTALDVVVTRCLFWNNHLDGQSASGISIGMNGATNQDTFIDYCLVEGGSGGIVAQNGSTFGYEHCIDLEPTFVDGQIPLGPDGILGTTDDGLVLQIASEGVDDGGVGMSGIDVRGVDRPRGSAHDIGAYETPQAPGN